MGDVLRKTEGSAQDDVFHIPVILRSGSDEGSFCPMTAGRRKKILRCAQDDRGESAQDDNGGRTQDDRGESAQDDNGGRTQDDRRGKFRRTGGKPGITGGRDRDGGRTLLL